MEMIESRKAALQQESDIRTLKRSRVKLHGWRSWKASERMIARNRPTPAQTLAWYQLQAALAANQTEAQSC
jgi:hypothetical protein